MRAGEQATAPPELVGLDVRGDAGPWRESGFAVDLDGTTRIGHVAVRVDPAGPHRPTWTFLGRGPGALDGVTTAWTDASLPEPGVHSNGASAVDHVVVLTPDVDRTVHAYADAGLSVRRVRHTEQYGPPYRQTFFRAGEVVLELIGPDTPSGDGPSRVYGIASTVDDLEATAAGLGDRLGRVKDAVQPGRRIATLRTKELGISIAVAFMSPVPRDPS